MTCPQEPLPAGWRIWRGDVPPELVEFAMSVRDKVRSYPYGSIAQTMNWQGAIIGAFVSHHTWTYRNGVLHKGICIPGVSLALTLPQSVSAGEPQDLSQPDPSLAMFPGDEGQAHFWSVFAAGIASGIVVDWLLRRKHWWKL